MSDSDKTQDYLPETSDNDDVEIIEVVGVDEDLPAPSASLTDEMADSEDVVLTLDGDGDPSGEESETDPIEPASPESAAQTDRGAPSLEPGVLETELVQRLRADYDNLRKRVSRERDAFEDQANSSFIEGLLPVLDNFDRALSVNVQTGADGAFRAGMVMIYEQFSAALEKEGLRRIDSVGQPFDPNLHDAVATDGESDLPPNTIIEELQRGYLFRDRVLRPAMVKVSTNGIHPATPERNGGNL
jgi:molecular chaperone GrpE